MMEKKLIEVKDLKLGMFVEELDRPWLETPFFFQGMLIESDNDIDELKRQCQHVYISIKKELPPKAVQERRFAFSAIPEEDDKKTPFHGSHVYKDIRTIDQELPSAQKAHDSAQNLIETIKTEIDNNFTLNINAAKQLVDVISKSMINNPNAMLLVNGFKSSSQQHYDRALTIAIHMIAFGRHLCLPTDELVILGLGGLLIDIGQLKLLSEADKDDADAFQKFNIIKEHVTYGVEILQEMPEIDPKVIEIVAQHHEREDGSGYPNGISASQISSYSRMAAIVDCYETIISSNNSLSGSSITPFEGMNTLWEWAHRWLNATLVQRFAHCIGIFPVGSLVELNTGEVAVVLAHSRANRLKPQLMVMLDPNKTPYESPKPLDLTEDPIGPNGDAYKITRDLKSDAYDIDPKKYYV